MSVNYSIFCAKKHSDNFPQLWGSISAEMLESVSLSTEHVSDEYQIHYGRSIPRLLCIEESGDGSAFSTVESRALAFHQIGAAVNSLGSEILRRQQEHIKNGDYFAAFIDDNFSYDSIHHLNSMVEMLQTMQRVIVRYPDHDFELVWF